MVVLFHLLTISDDKIFAIFEVLRAFLANVLVDILQLGLVGLKSVDQVMEIRVLSSIHGVNLANGQSLNKSNLDLLNR